MRSIAISHLIGHIIFCAVVHWLMLFALPYDSAAQWIQLRGGDEYDLLADSTQVTILVPVTLDSSIIVSTVGIRLIQVRIGKRADARFQRAFSHPNTLVETPMRGLNLPITVDLTKVNTPGIYEVLLEARRATGPPQDLTLKINYPIPTLASVPTHRFRLTRRLIGRLIVQGTQLRLSETSGNAWLTGVTLQPREFADETKAPVDVETLALENMPLTIPPDSTVQAKLSLAGNFPLGKTNGTAVLDADQLTSPVVVNVEIETRRAIVLIFWIIAAGLLLGFVLRTALQRQVSLNEARLKGLDLEERMVRALERNPDAGFQEELQPKLTQLQQKLKATSIFQAIFIKETQAQDLTDAVTKADEAFQTALTNLETRQAEVQTRLADLARVTNTRLRLPPSIAGVLGEAHQKTEAALQSLQAGKIREAGQQADQVHQHLQDGLKKPVKDWKFSVDLNDYLRPDQMLLPANVTESLKQAIVEYDTLLSAVSLPNPDSSLDEIKTMLTAVHMVHTNILDLMRYLSRWVQTALDETIAPLKDIKNLLPDRNIVQKLISTVNEFTKELVAFIEDGRYEDLISMLKNQALESLDNCWRETILNQNQDQEVKNLVQERKYVEAAQTAAANLRKLAPSHKEQDTMLGDEDEVTSLPQEKSGLGGWWISHRDVVADIGAAVIMMRREERPNRVQISRLNTVCQLVVSKIVRWIIAGIGIAVVGYLLFHKTFVGTFDEIAGIFFWAFGLDVTVDAFWEQGKKLIPSR